MKKENTASLLDYISNVLSKRSEEIAKLNAYREKASNELDVLNEKINSCSLSGNFDNYEQLSMEKATKIKFIEALSQEIENANTKSFLSEQDSISAKEKISCVQSEIDSKYHNEIAVLIKQIMELCKQYKEENNCINEIRKLLYVDVLNDARFFSTVWNTKAYEEITSLERTLINPYTQQPRIS